MAVAWRRLSRVSQGFFFSEKPAVLCRTMQTSVWWDINDCKIPKGCDPSSVAGNITSSILKMKEHCPISFPISFSGYVDMDLIDPKAKQGLSETGINLTHVPYSRDKHAVGTKILCDQLKWSKAHPPPANCVFIFDDWHWCYLLKLLNNEGYKIVLAKPRWVDDDMGDAVTTLCRTSYFLSGRLFRWCTIGKPSD